MNNYKSHLFRTIKDGIYHPSRMQCGRHLQRNSKGTFALKLSSFVEYAKTEPTLLCEKCLEWAKEKNKI